MSAPPMATCWASPPDSRIGRPVHQRVETAGRDHGSEAAARSRRGRRRGSRVRTSAQRARWRRRAGGWVLEDRAHHRGEALQRGHIGGRPRCGPIQVGRRCTSGDEPVQGPDERRLAASRRSGHEQNLAGRSRARYGGGQLRPALVAEREVLDDGDRIGHAGRVIRRESGSADPGEVQRRGRAALVDRDRQSVVGVDVQDRVPTGTSPKVSAHPMSRAPRHRPRLDRAARPHRSDRRLQVGSESASLQLPKVST